MKKIKLYALTGFLGAGKTTVLKTLLENLQQEKIGVIQNEFGKLSIDGEILRNDDIKMVEINKGSIFCSCLKLSFVEALAEMAKQDINYLFVESSGLADPSNMQEILKAVYALAGDAYDFEGAICLVDALHFNEQLEDTQTVSRQLKHCNLAIISKIDLIDTNKLDDVIKKIIQVNPVCKIIQAENGKFDLSFLKEDLSVYSWAECEQSLNSAENKPKTLFLNCHKNISKADFDEFLQRIKGDCYRLKGFFLLDNVWQQVDAVLDKIDYKTCDAKEYSQLVIISRVGANVIKSVFTIWEEIFGEKPELKN
ncbi:MAG: GTP-binding protein [Oscillospiraceae bacterium]